MRPVQPWHAKNAFEFLQGGDKGDILHLNKCIFFSIIWYNCSDILNVIIILLSIYITIEKNVNGKQIQYMYHAVVFDWWPEQNYWNNVALR